MKNTLTVYRLRSFENVAGDEVLISTESREFTKVDLPNSQLASMNMDYSPEEEILGVYVDSADGKTWYEFSCKFGNWFIPVRSGFAGSDAFLEDGFEYWTTLNSSDDTGFELKHRNRVVYTHETCSV